LTKDKREFSGREILAGEAPQNLRIPVRLHPKVPAGTVIGWCENLPIQYQSNEAPNVAEIKTRQDYYQVDCYK
jgi:hypothetical protein